jgi:hypothetical protein
MTFCSIDQAMQELQMTRLHAFFPERTPLVKTVEGKSRGGAYRQANKSNTLSILDAFLLARQDDGCALQLHFVKRMGPRDENDNWIEILVNYR